MISAPMSRRAKVLVLSACLTVVAVVVTACGTQGISVPKAQAPVFHGAVLFSQRCSGCHTLSYAGTHGSAANVRTAQYNNGPNFNVRCERPVDRVLYAIENGGFSGAIMPQNIVVGEDAREVAQFVATYAGRQAPEIPGVVKCQNESIGSLPPPSASAAASAGSSSSGG
jgi:hypothetical protein